MYFLCSLHIACVCTFLVLQSYELFNNIAATSKTGIKHKLLSVQEELDIINTVMLLKFFSQKIG
jgi:hypothetical protein